MHVMIRQPISAPVLDTFLEEWKTGQLKTYAVDTGGDAKYHTSIESLPEYKELTALDEFAADQGREKYLNYLYYDDLEKDMWQLLRDECNIKGVWRSRRTCTALWYKGPDGFLGWHNNRGTPRDADACFISYVETAGDSFFRYVDIDTGELVTDYDEPGWYVRSWTWDLEDPFWHCVYSNSNRISIGFQCKFKDGTFNN